MYVLDVVFSKWRGTLYLPLAPQSEGRGGSRPPPAPHFEHPCQSVPVRNYILGRRSNSIVTEIFTLNAHQPIYYLTQDRSKYPGPRYSVWN